MLNEVTKNLLEKFKTLLSECVKKPLDFKFNFTETQINKKYGAMSISEFRFDNDKITVVVSKIPTGSLYVSIFSQKKIISKRYKFSNVDDSFEFYEQIVGRNNSYLINSANEQVYWKNRNIGNRAKSNNDFTENPIK